jgi:filamentous hemagglutinin
MPPPPGYVPVSETRADQVRSSNAPTPQQPPSSSSPTSLVDPNLVDQIVASNKRITPENVVAKGMTPNGQIVWTETGDAKRGLQHILSHSSDFAGIGVMQSQILDVIMGAISQGNIIYYIGKQNEVPRAVYRVVINGQAYGIAISIGSNGFIVGANPTGRVP